jgi:hypothetical protein
VRPRGARRALCRRHVVTGAGSRSMIWVRLTAFRPCPRSDSPAGRAFFKATVRGRAGFSYHRLTVLLEFVARWDHDDRRSCRVTSTRRGLPSGTNPRLYAMLLWRRASFSRFGPFLATSGRRALSVRRKARRLMEVWWAGMPRALVRTYGTVRELVALGYITSFCREDAAVRRVVRCSQGFLQGANRVFCTSRRLLYLWANRN